MSSVEELHAEIVANPGSPDAYLVLADLLASEGDPRGELIALQHRLTAGASDRMLRVRAKKLMDRFVAQLARDTGASGEWHLGYVRVGCPKDAHSLRALFAHPSACVMTELRIDRTIHGQDDLRAHAGALHALVAALAERPRPTLRTLSIRVDYDPYGDPYDRRPGRRFEPRELPPFVNPSWEALPQLERLRLAGDPIFPDLVHPTLRELVLEGAPLGDGAWELPALRALDWTRPYHRVDGNRWDYGAALRARRVQREDAMQAALWNRPLPALRDLTLRGSVSAGLLVQPYTVTFVSKLARLCAPASTLAITTLDPARLAHLERIVVTEIQPDTVPTCVRRALKQAAWTPARSTDPKVFLDAKKLPRG